LVSFVFFSHFTWHIFCCLCHFLLRVTRTLVRRVVFPFLGVDISLPRTLSSILGGMMGYISIFFPFSHGRPFLKLLFGDFLVCWVSFFLLLLCVLPLVCLCSWNLLCLLLTCVFVLTFCHLIFPSLPFLVCFVWVLEDLNWFRAATISFF
jgi:hypothetical protein